MLKANQQQSAANIYVSKREFIVSTGVYAASTEENRNLAPSNATYQPEGKSFSLLRGHNNSLIN
jgi:hypothetical protein